MTPSRRRWLDFILLWLCSGAGAFGADTLTTYQIGQGVVYRHYHYDALYNAKEEIYVIDVNLNDPAPSMKFPYLTGGATRTVSAHAGTVPGAIAAVNGQFFSTSTGPVAFLKITGSVITTTQSGVHDEQGLTDDGGGRTNSLGITLKPGGGWASLAASNAMTAGPDLIRNGVKFTSYDMNDSLVTNRNPRTCVAWTYDNHLLLTVVDGRSSASAGLTLPELRDYLYTNASVRNAFNLDGGGSSTMWVTNQVMNVPSDGTPRAVADAVVIVAPPPAIPGAPSGLTAVGGIDQVALSWNPVTGATAYRVKRSLSSSGTYSVIANVAGTSFTDTGLSNGTTYYYVVAASNGSGEGTNSLPVSATPQLLLLAAPVLSPSNVVVQAWGGLSGQLFYVLAAPNPALPATQWTRVATNRFGPGGYGTVTNSLVPSLPQQFYRLQTSFP